MKVTLSGGAALVRRAAGDGEHVALLQGQLRGAFAAGGQVLAGLAIVAVRAAGGTSKLVDCGAVKDLHDVVAAFVPLELLGAVRGFDGHHHGDFVQRDEIVVARLGQSAPWRRRQAGLQ